MRENRDGSRGKAPVLRDESLSHKMEILLGHFLVKGVGSGGGGSRGKGVN